MIWHLNLKSSGTPERLQGGDSADAQFRLAQTAANRHEKARLQADALKYGQQTGMNTTGTNVSLAGYAGSAKSPKREKGGE